MTDRTALLAAISTLADALALNAAQVRQLCHECLPHCPWNLRDIADLSTPKLARLHALLEALHTNTEVVL